jgi:hypothetical protein
VRIAIRADAGAGHIAHRSRRQFDAADFFCPLINAQANRRLHSLELA